MSPFPPESAAPEQGDYIAWIRDKVGPEPIQLTFAAACIVHEERLLVQRRGDDGAWGLPGGCVELGEAAADAVVREVAEETGLTVTVDYLLGVYTKYWHTYPNGDVTQPIAIVFVCSPTGGALQVDDTETLALAWHHLDDLPPFANPQYTDIVADLATGRRAFYR